MKKIPIRGKDSLLLGENVWWLYTPRGGYGYSYYVPAIVAKINKKTVSIAAQKKDGTYKVVKVSPENLYMRWPGERAL